VERVVAVSPAMKRLLRLVNRVAPTSSSVLITGETGRGKEIIARAVHAASPRATHAFVPVNCAAIPNGLAEAELFGYRKGAFTGADVDKPGLVEEAHRGTLFLDEIGELPVSMQAALLRFLDTGESRRIGENRSRRADVRIIAATNRSMDAHLADGRFRADLYYRLCESTCRVPPLRDRPEDIVAIASQWCADQPGHRQITPAGLSRLLAHRWPGNVRELRSVLGRALLFSAGCIIDERTIDVALGVAGADVAEPAAPAGADESARVRAALDRNR